MNRAPHQPPEASLTPSKCSLLVHTSGHSAISDSAIQDSSCYGPRLDAATRRPQADKPDATQDIDELPGSWPCSSSDSPGIQPGGSFPGSFLGLEAPATVARVREAIGGPSIAAMLRNAAGLSPAGPCSAGDWELV